MCGIAGIVFQGAGHTEGLTSAPAVGGETPPPHADAPEALARRVAERLRPPGPDACTAWVAASGACALGHARLRVIDLETGDQPIGNEDGSVQAVFNGEIYNFQALRTELEAAGHRFRTRTDTEVL